MGPLPNNTAVEMGVIDQLIGQLAIWGTLTGSEAIIITVAAAAAAMQPSGLPADKNGLLAVDIRP